MSDNEATDDTTAEIDALAGALDTTSLAPADAGEAAPTLFAAAADDAGSAGEASDDEDVDEMPFMDDEDAMPPAVLARVLLLRKLHDTKVGAAAQFRAVPSVEILTRLLRPQASLVDEFKKKRKDLEREFQAALAPHDAKRLEVVSGDCDVNLSKEADGGDLSDDIVGKLRGEEEDAEGPLEGSEVLGVPDFWLTTMLRHELVMQMVEEDDVHALKALKDVKIVENADMDGFSVRAPRPVCLAPCLAHRLPSHSLQIEFFFGANPYFDNAVLTKKYSVPNLLDHEEPILDDVAGTAIKWKTGMNLCVKQIKKKQTKKRGREAGKTRIVTKNVRVDSFFNFFTAPTMPEEAEDDEDVRGSLSLSLARSLSLSPPSRSTSHPHPHQQLEQEVMEAF